MIKKQMVFSFLFFCFLLQGCTGKYSDSSHQESSVVLPAVTQAGEIAATNSVSEKSSSEVKDQSGDQTAGESGTAEEEIIYVHICGAVKHPGVYRLKSGSRVYQVIEAAGGFSELADMNYVNQSEIVKDGIKILIPTQEEVKAGLTIASQSAGGSIKEDGLVNLNTASVNELCTLPGIGQSKAESILNYREKNGKFQKIEDIMKIEGIKEGSFQKLKDKITVH